MEKARNVKARIDLPIKGSAKKGFALKNPPSVRPKKNKHAE
jgi:hypothetical protein